MKNNKLLDRQPSVQITSKRNELKVYQDNIIYLNDGDNFELRFFNPLKEKIGVEVIFNSVKKGDSYLILNPGQDIFLDRFLDEQRKMVFETYNIDGNNKEAVEAVENNGLITFNFYKEYFRSNTNNEVNVKYEFPPKPDKNGSFNGIYYNNFSLSAGNSNGFSQFGNSNSNSRIYSTNDINYAYTQSCNSFNNSTFNTTGNVGLGSISTSSLNINSTPTSSTTSINSIETGRIEKGELSDQKLKNVNVEFSNTSFYSIAYKLMPNSTKSQSINEIREYCGDCGYRLRKSTWKFCPKCGNKIL